MRVPRLRWVQLTTAGYTRYDTGEFRTAVKRNGTIVDQGWASNVLGGPLSALRHLVEVLDNDPVNPPLAGGEIVTTGTLTRAFPVAPGETWTTKPKGVALDGVAIRFT